MQTGSGSKKLFLIFDERARKDAQFQDAVEEVRGRGHTVLLRQIQVPKNAARFAAEAVDQNIDRIVAVGGDGMINRLVYGMLHERTEAPCALALVPFGTGNDLARAGGIPVGDPLEALEIAVDAIPVGIDVGRVDEFFFVNAVTGGFPAEAVAGISRKTKEIFGKFAYVLTGLANVGSLSAKKVRFTAPGLEWEGPIHGFTLGNGRQAGGGLTIAPGALLDDGLFDLMIIPESEEGLLPLLVEFSQMDDPDRLEHIICVQVPSLNLECRETIYLNLDGETVSGKKFRFDVQPQLLPLCLPRNSPVIAPPADRRQ